jgi:(d)CTP diphosphatase
LNSQKVHTNVVCAIIENANGILICKRAVHKENAGLWEFPGGKVKIGEGLSEALERELLEELGVKSRAFEVLSSVSVSTENGLLVLTALRAEIESESFEPKDHSEFKWLKFNDMQKLPMTLAEEKLIIKIADQIKVRTK